MRGVAALDAESHATTGHLRQQMASVSSAAELSAAFRAWITTLRHLAARGDALARELDLPDCRSLGSGHAGRGPGVGDH